MHLTPLIDAMARFEKALPALVSGISRTDARWKPPDGAWSILEIVTHLADEEVSDFRTRVETTLRDEEATWPPIDPEGWAVERKYNEGDLAESLARFLGERQDSLAWLRTLDNPDFSATHMHPRAGSMTAGDVMVSWVAHDALHLRQIAKRMHQLAEHHGGYSAAYAGGW